MKAILIAVMCVMAACVTDVQMPTFEEADSVVRSPAPDPSFCPTDSTWDPLTNDCQTNGGGTGGGGDTGGGGGPTVTCVGDADAAIHSFCSGLGLPCSDFSCQPNSMGCTDCNANANPGYVVCTNINGLWCHIY